MINELTSRPVRLGRRPPVRAVDPATVGVQQSRGALAGGTTPGSRRQSSARASAPVARNRSRAVGPDRLGTVGLSRFRDVEAIGTTAALPASLRQGGPQLTAATGVTPSPVVVVFQRAGA